MQTIHYVVIDENWIRLIITFITFQLLLEGKENVTAHFSLRLKVSYQQNRNTNMQLRAFNKAYSSTSKTHMKYTISKC